jgi:hypothetical protein
VINPVDCGSLMKNSNTGCDAVSAFVGRKNRHVAKCDRYEYSYAWYLHIHTSIRYFRVKGIYLF